MLIYLFVGLLVWAALIFSIRASGGKVTAKWWSLPLYMAVWPLILIVLVFRISKS